MASDHRPVEAEFASGVAEVDPAKLWARRGIPRSTKGTPLGPVPNPKFEECVAAVAEAIAGLPEQAVAEGDLDRLIETVKGACETHEVERGRRTKAAATTEIHRLRAWAAVAAELYAEKGRAGGDRRVWHLTARHGPLAPLLVWMPQLGKPHTDWSAVASLLRGWADRMSAAVREENRRQRQAVFFRQYADAAAQWGEMMNRTGRAERKAVDRLVVKERIPIVPEAPEEGHLSFTDGRTRMEVALRLEQTGAAGRESAGLRVTIGEVSVCAGRVSLSAKGEMSVEGDGYPPRKVLIPGRGRASTVNHIVGLCQAAAVEVETAGVVEQPRTTTDPAEVSRGLAEWAAETSAPAFSQGPPFSKYEQWLDRAGIPVAGETERREAAGLLLRPLERAEFDRHLNKKAGMAAGLDGCTWELLQKLPPEAKDRVFAVLKNLMLHGYDHDTRQWRLGVWLKRAWTSPIPKSKFDGTTDRLRGISVTPAIARLLGKI
eukprot:gene8413-8159_t